MDFGSFDNGLKIAIPIGIYARIIVKDIQNEQKTLLRE